MDSNNESQLESDSESIFDDESIDLDFIEEFDKTMMQYRDFYKENVETIKVKFLYVNKENRLEKIKHDDLILKTPNIITCGELIKILKSNNKVMNKYYKISSMCLYNVSIEADNIEKIKEEHFLVNINHINDVIIEPTINILQDLNELLIIFKEKEKQNNRVKSRKIHIKINNDLNSSKNNKTRKKIL
jgi:hypothetical protein